MFRTEDLDNDNVISDVESSPTYKRTRQVLESIRGKASGNTNADNNAKNEEPVQGVISFT